MNFKFECSSLTATKKKKKKKKRMVTEICVWAKRRGEYSHASRFQISPLTCVSSVAKYREMIFINSSFFFRMILINSNFHDICRSYKINLYNKVTNMYDNLFNAYKKLHVNGIVV
jgi:hypothetical protein